MIRLAILGCLEGIALFLASRIADPLGDLAPFLWFVACAFVIAMHAFRTTGSEPAPFEPDRVESALAPGGVRAARAWRNAPIVTVLAFGALFRALFILAPPALSSDVYRYVWDARAQSAGINPFVYAPVAPEVDSLFDAGTARISHPEISTIYPPVSQLAFRAAHAVAPGPIGMKLLFGLIDLAIPLAALAALRPPLARRLPFVVLLAWHPLAVIETAGSGHNDPLAIALLLGAIAAARGHRALLAGALLGAATAAKTLPILLAPVFALALVDFASGATAERTRGRAAGTLLRFFTGIAAVLVFAYFPFAGAGRALFRGLAAYSLDLEFNASVFALAKALLRAIAPGDAAPPATWAFVLRLLPLLPVVAAPLVWRAARGDLPRAVFLTLAGLVVVSSQVHPWYLLWLLPFLAATPSRGWLLFTFLIFISYETHALYRSTGVWNEPAGIRLLQYAPVYLLLLAEATAPRLVRAEPPPADDAATPSGEMSAEPSAPSDAEETKA